MCDEIEAQAADWSLWQPRFDSLANLALDADTLPGWLEEWSTLEKTISEMIALAAITYAQDTSDSKAQANHLRFAGQDTHRLEQQHLRLALRLAEAPALPQDLQPVARAAQDKAATFRVEHLADQQRHGALVARYEEIVGAITVEWRGERVPLSELAPYGTDPDRATREAAYRAFLGAYIDRRDDFSTLFDELYLVRQRIAHTAGFLSFVDFTYRAQSRPYSPDDARVLHTAIERHVVPALTRRYERRRRLLHLDTLMSWDSEIDPTGGAPLLPSTSPEDLLAKTERVFGHIRPSFGQQLSLMRCEGLIDIEPRLHKAPGGFCTTLDVRERPFIFGTWLGTSDDVRLMVHEGGHAMHGFAVYEHQPLILQRFPGAEMNELVSMSMELLAAPFLSVETGGYYEPDDARRARIAQLEEILSLLTYIARIDAFQMWLYESGEGHDATARDAAWLAVSRRFDAGISWETFPDGLVARWHQQSLIFTAPLYMIEYAFAQFGALQIWQRSQSDHAGAVARLQQAMILGNTRSAAELYEIAGASLVPSTEEIVAMVAFIEAQLDGLDSH